MFYVVNPDTAECVAKFAFRHNAEIDAIKRACDEHNKSPYVPESGKLNPDECNIDDEIISMFFIVME